MTEAASSSCPCLPVSSQTERHGGGGACCAACPMPPGRAHPPHGAPADALKDALAQGKPCQLPLRWSLSSLSCSMPLLSGEPCSCRLPMPREAVVDSLPSYASFIALFMLGCWMDVGHATPVPERARATGHQQNLHAALSDLQLSSRVSAASSRRCLRDFRSGERGRRSRSGERGRR